MSWTWIFGYVLAGILIWVGISQRVRGMKSSTKQLFVVVGAFLLILTVALSLDDLFHWWDKFPKVLIGLTGILIILDRCVRITFARRRGGPMLLDLGRVRGPDLIINIFTGLALAWIALQDVTDIVQTSHWSLQDVSLQIFGLSIAFAVLVQGISKRRLVERGVFHGTGLSTWDEFESFNWEKESTTSSTLVLHKRSKGPFFRLLTLSVRLEDVRPVEEMLRQHRISRVGEVEERSKDAEV